MAAPTYTEFEWHAEGAGNGESGEKLTRVFVELVKKLDGVRSICDLGCGNGHISGRLAHSVMTLPESMRPRVEFRSRDVRIRALSLLSVDRSRSQSRTV
jgi:methylase of polypeptide subunit release factors